MEKNQSHPEEENYLKIANMAPEEQPVNKLFLQGASSLSDAELLAILLGSGTRKLNVLSLAQRVLNCHPIYKGLNGIGYLTGPELMKISGIGHRKAAAILALSELSKRISKAGRSNRIRFLSSQEVADYFMEELRFLEKECVMAVFLDGSNYLLKYVKLTEGSVKMSYVPVRELFLEALRYGAVYMILLHNHPSGNPEPSDADLIVTSKVCEAGKFLEIRLLDHIIIGDRSFISLAERGIIS